MRGYSWTTLVPASLAPVVIPRLESSAKLTWRVLPTGALLIQAGESPQEYEAAAMNELFERLAPVLPSGVPLIHPKLMGIPSKLLVARDARDVAPFHADTKT